MATRRSFIRGLGASVVTACAAALQPACTRAPLLLSSRRYRVGYLAPRYDGCVAPSEWEIINGVAVRSMQTAPRWPLCREIPLIEALAARGYRLGESLAWLQVGPITVVPSAAGGYSASAYQRWSGGAEGDFMPPARYLTARQPDVIVADGEDATRAASSMNGTVPIVASNVNDMVEIGLVSNIARPDGNVTGVSFRTSDLTIKRIELLKEAFRGVKRPILVYGTRPSDIAAIGLAVDVARHLGLSPIPVPFAPSWGTPSSLTDPMCKVVRAPGVSDPWNPPEQPMPDALVCVSGGQFALVRQNLDAALQRGADSIVVTAALREPEPLVDYLWMLQYQGRPLPGVFPTPEYDSVGAITLREPSDLFEQVATYVDKILRGAKPSELPIVSPTDLEIVVNLKSAHALGLTIAPRAMAMATTVIR